METKTRAFFTSGLLIYLAGASLSFLWTSPGSLLLAMLLRITGLACFGWLAIRRRSLTPWILWAMLAGIEVGLDAPAMAIHLRVLSDIFLRLIRTIVAPLILGTLITGVAAHGSSGKVGRLGLKSLVYFEILTTLALLIGLAAINLTQAGAGLAITPPLVAASVQPQTQQPLEWDQFLIHIFPENLARSVADNQILQVAVFAILFGLALGRLPEEKRAPMLRLAESLTAAMFQFTNIVMYLAPLGVGAAMAFTVAHAGAGAMASLAKLLLTYYGAILAFLLLVLLPVALIARVPLRDFMSAIAEPASIAFATSTSEAALPRAMEAMEALGVPRRIVGFVIPAGYSFNLDGGALYLSLAAIFVAQAAGLHLDWRRQIVIMATLMLTSKGTAGVPRGSFVVLMASAAILQLPVEPVAILLGVDALMDMGRTTVNVVGNCLASVVIARWEGQFQLELPVVSKSEALED